jgi:hypothetical protein
MQGVTVLVHMVCCHFNPLNAELNPFCHLLALLGAIFFTLAGKGLRFPTFHSQSDYSETSIHHCHIHHFPTIIVNSNPNKAIHTHSVHVLTLDALFLKVWFYCILHTEFFVLTYNCFWEDITNIHNTIFQQHMHCTYNVTLRCVHATIVAVEK